ncbi:hypothetical protein LTS15_006941 [Exophiala xenobiotica]|nr:hypothetical protein LTS15_006941 [Exophiala xenobiotica]
MPLDLHKFRSQVARSRHSMPSRSPFGKLDPNLVPPAPDTDGSSNFECPYCYFILSVDKYQNGASWLEHVTHDAEPYVCLFDRCPSPQATYASGTAWKHHMRSKHLQRWRCSADGHEGEIFETAEAFEAHLRSAHSDEEHTDEEAQLIVENSTFVSNGIFVDCPFCGDTAQNSSPNTRDADLENHVAMHLLHIAFLSTPIPENIAVHMKGEDQNSLGFLSEADHPGGTTTTIQKLLDDRESTSSPGSPVSASSAASPIHLDYNSPLLSSRNLQAGTPDDSMGIPYTWDTIYDALQVPDRHTAPSLEEYLADPKMLSFISNKSSQDTSTQLQQHNLQGFRSPTDLECTFVPSDTLANEVFSDEALLSRLLTYAYAGSVPVLSAHVRRDFLKVFYILLNIRKLHYIHVFVHMKWSDNVLPIDDVSECPEISDIRDLFWAEQWRFHVPHLTQNFRQRWHAQTILPLISEDLIFEAKDLQIRKLSIHQAYSNLSCRGNAQAFVVLKSYARTWPLSSALYDTEVDAYEMMIRHLKDCDNITQSFGSFEKGDWLYLMLEYADLGSLYDYLKDVNPPASSEETKAFWSEVIKLTAGLAQLHHIDVEDGFILGLAWLLSVTIGSCHNDIKPENVLVMTGPDGQPLFKLADFALAKFVHVDESGSRGGTSSSERAIERSKGTRTYGAPELFLSRADDSMAVPENQRISDAQKGDVWSLGCVLSVVASYVVLGYSGVLEYQENRLNANEAANIEAQDTFHDSTVTEVWHDKLCSESKPYDKMTRAVIGFLDTCVLVNTKKRATAAELRSELTQTMTLDSPTTAKGKARVHLVEDNATSQPALADMPQPRYSLRTAKRQKTELGTQSVDTSTARRSQKPPSSQRARPQKQRSSQNLRNQSEYQSVPAYRLTSKQFLAWLEKNFGERDYQIRLMHDRYHFRFDRPLTLAEREDLDDDLRN